MSRTLKPTRPLLERAAPLIPVLQIQRAEHAAPLAAALVDGGLAVLEVTLRTSAALAAIEAMREVPGAIVGAGTVNSATQLEQAARAGAEFAVSPGLTPTLLAAAADTGIPLLPGIATASEMLLGLEHGCDCFKFFPAHYTGGPALLKAFAGPFAHVAFCPTGGISLENARDYLALDNVLCVGGSWLAPGQLLEADNWNAIAGLARETKQKLQ